MLETEFKLEYEIEELPADGGVPVIVVAAGSSTRMNGINKQTALLCGVPLIIRTLMQFEKCSKISNIILVVKPDELFSMQQLADGYSIKKLSCPDFSEIVTQKTQKIHNLHESHKRKRFRLVILHGRIRCGT